MEAAVMQVARIALALTAVVALACSDASTGVLESSDEKKNAAKVSGQSDTTIHIGGGGGGPVVPVPPATAVAEFDLTAVISGQLPGTDTSRVEAVAGAVVTLSRIGTVASDTLKPSVLIGSATTNANGSVSFPKLSTGYYRATIAAPASSPYADGAFFLGPPSVIDVRTTAKLARK
jgi:hypothetical protein